MDAKLTENKINEKIHIMLDSGAFSIFVDMHNRRGIKNYHETKEFWDFVDRYCLWLQNNKQYLDLYVAVDVIFNPEATLKVQKYMEDVYHLNPLPVFHPREDFKFLKYYMDNYGYFGIGGLGHDFPKHQYIGFGDKVFDLVCPAPSRMPRWKVHGFGITSTTIAQRYPFYSVDSSSFIKYAAWGWIAVPKYDTVNKRYNFDDTPQIIAISTRHRFLKEEGRHFFSYTELERKYITEYIERLGFKIGKSEHKKVTKDYKLQENEFWFKKSTPGEYVIERVIEPGLCNNTYTREEYCIAYTIDLQNSMPEWPWPFMGGSGTIPRLNLLKRFEDVDIIEQK